MPGTKRLRNSLTVAALAAVFAASLPVGAAHAINIVDCGNRTDLLKFTGHDGAWPATRVRCYANKGTLSVRLWADQISTGNNDIEYLDYNGAKVRIKRWTIMNFPNRPPHVDTITIL
ncbi:oxidoreductase [Nonomuraea longispora]|uniref:Oxidoreductase n=1 Tax=Nonomuraea longispora TaxID=1848320 RepID=A0A4R4NCL3_9ACTN|nr:beta/gamma crystallin domain-containing protein [Nonomuraea longispora]TDC06649.1 oxidoreductase [Nonomuraea longispora]